MRPDADARLVMLAVRGCGRNVSNKCPAPFNDPETALRETTLSQSDAVIRVSAGYRLGYVPFARILSISGLVTRISRPMLMERIKPPCMSGNTDIRRKFQTRTLAFCIDSAGNVYRRRFPTAPGWLMPGSRPTFPLAPGWFSPGSRPRFPTTPGWLIPGSATARDCRAEPPSP